MHHKVNEGIDSENFSEVIRHSLQLNTRKEESNIILFTDRDSVIDQVFHYYFGYDNKKEFIKNSFLQIEDAGTLIKIFLQKSKDENVLSKDEKGVVIGVYTKPEAFNKLFDDSNYENLHKIYLPWHKKELTTHLEKNKDSIAL